MTLFTCDPGGKNMKKIFVNLIILVGMLVSLLAFTGVAPAYASSVILFNPNPVTFHSQLVLTNEPSRTVTVRLTNSTLSTQALGYFVLSRSDFLITTNNCLGVTLQPNGHPGASCMLVLLFYPHSAGAIIGQLWINAPNGTTHLGVLWLSGMGLPGTNLTRNGLFSSGNRIPTNWVKIGAWSKTDGRFCNIAFLSSPCAVRFVGGTTLKGISYTVSKPGGAGSAFYFSLWASGTSVPTKTAANAWILLYNGLNLVKIAPLPVAYTGTYPFKIATSWFIAPASYNRVVVKLNYQAATGTVWYDNVSVLWAP
jgi:hypothetical protein